MARTLDPRRWPSPPPLPDEPAKLRRAMGQDAHSEMGVNAIAVNIAVYPELQLATLKLIAERPGHLLLQLMAEAILGTMLTETEPSEDQQRAAINAAMAALQAAANLDTRKELPT